MAQKKQTVHGLGARIVAARQARGLAQVALAALMGWRQAELSKVETGERNPSGARVVELAKALGVSADYLLGMKPETPAKPRKPARRGPRKP